jgi:hypothetical protein
MKSVTIDQSHQAMSALATNANWEVIDGDVLQQAILEPKRFGQEFTRFLQNGGRMQTSLITSITSRFTPETFPGLGAGWKLIPEEHDSKCPDAIADIKFIKLLVMLKDGENAIGGEEKLKRLKELGNIRLTADWFLFFFTNQHLIPEEWKKVSAVYFDGDVLLSPGGNRSVLYLGWDGGRWCWDGHWLDIVWDSSEPSAGLAS